MSINKQASVIKSLFLGNIIEENLFPFPLIEGEEADTIKMILESVDRFMAENHEELKRFDVEGMQSDEYIESLKELGLFGLIIPETFDGIGLSSAGYARVMQQASRHDGSTALTIGAHSSIGMKGLLLFGTDAQKQAYLPRLATGEMIAAFCLTEPGSGSDAASIKTNAVKNEDGTWTLNGEKIWITNGAFAEYFTVFARTDSEHGKISAFIVERSFAGVSSGPKEDKMGIRASATTTVSFQNVIVPANNLLGEEGKGFKIAMAILNNGRTGLGGGSIGAMKACIELAIKQSSERKQFGQAISEFGLIQEKIGQMTVDCFVAEAAVGELAALIDNDSDDYSTEAAACKIFCSEALWRAGNEALQIAGGNGFMKEYPYERIVRDSRINMIFEGTNEILRLFIALSGLKDAGVHLKEIGSAASNIFNDPIKGFGTMSTYASRKFSHLTGLGGERISVHERLRNAARVFELGTLGLARTAENVLREHKKDIVNQQFICKRLADAAIDLFVGMAALARVDRMIAERGEQACATEIRILDIFADQAKHRLKSNLLAVSRKTDSDLSAVSNALVNHGSYRWDLFKE
jgi:alkylation response protein AidB-like acyl-CoA dehydrogenase